MFPFIQCQCVDKRRGVYLLENVSVFIEIRVLFWTEISALGVFLNLITGVCAPLNTQVPPPPPWLGCSFLRLLCALQLAYKVIWQQT